MHLKSIRIIQTLIAILAFSFSSFAQAPNLLNYQGVARNSVGNPLPNQTMTLRVSIRNNSTTGPVLYTETRTIQTNLGGLFSVQIGSAGTVSSTGTIAGINWQVGTKYLQVEIDPKVDNHFLNLGTVLLVSVPYAFTAENAAKVITNANLTGVVTSVGNQTSIANGVITSDMIGSLTKSKVGLDLVNNTSDASKPISTLTQAALDLKANMIDVTNSLDTKVDKVIGKNLSTNDFTTVEKTKLAAISGTNTGDQDLSLYASSVSVTNSLATKVDKVNGKVLSTNDYTTVEKNKLSAITGTNTGDQDLSLFATTTSVALKENQSNKSTDVLLGGTNASDVLFPTQKAVKAFVAANSSSGGVADGGITNIKIANLAVTDSKISDVAASKITGTTLASNVVNASLTSVGTLNNLTVTNPIAGSVTGNAATATKLAASKNINGVPFDGTADITLAASGAASDLTGTTIASNVVNSSLTLSA
jgi:hypothetical protein